MEEEEEEVDAESDAFNLVNDRNPLGESRRERGGRGVEEISGKVGEGEKGDEREIYEDIGGNEMRDSR